MQKVKSLFLSILAVILGALCFVGCGASNEQIVGTYQFFKKETINYSWAVGDDYFGETLTEDFMTLVLNSDNTFSLTEKEEGETHNRVGTWAEEDGKVTLSIEAVGIKTGTLDGNTITFEVMGQKTILKK